MKVPSTIFMRGGRGSNSTLRLFLDGEPVAHSRALPALAPADSPLRIGNDRSGETPFLGRIEGLHCSVLGLTDAAGR